MNNTAFVFPGQGSQSVGMLADLATAYSSVKDTFATASAALGYDLWDRVQRDPDNLLNRTDITQPALLTASVAIHQLVAEHNSTPTIMAGHSLGEYSALVCAGVLNFAEAVKLVEMRGKYMQQAVPAGEGAMYAIIGLDDASIEKICAEVAEGGQVIAPVNYNSPGQVVIAGSAESAKLAAEQCKAAGAKRALPLAVSVPSHCALMKPAAQQLEKALAEVTLNTPSVPVVNNVDVAQQTDASAIKDALVRQLYMPVQWTKTVESFAAAGITHVYEIGPGKVLTGLNKRINKTLTCVAVNTPDMIKIEQE